MPEVGGAHGGILDWSVVVDEIVPLKCRAFEERQRCGCKKGRSSDTERNIDRGTIAKMVTMVVLVGGLLGKVPTRVLTVRWVSVMLLRWVSVMLRTKGMIRLS